MWRYAVICLIFASMTGIGLNILSNALTAKQKYLENLQSSIKVQNERLRILKTEWAFFTNPQKLEALVISNLDMHSVKHNQIIKVEDLSLRSSAWKMEEGVSRKNLISASIIKMNKLGP
jgi:hypothetical protein